MSDTTKRYRKRLDESVKNQIKVFKDINSMNEKLIGLYANQIDKAQEEVIEQQIKNLFEIQDALGDDIEATIKMLGDDNA